MSLLANKEYADHLNEEVERGIEPADLKDLGYIEPPAELSSHRLAKLMTKHATPPAPEVPDMRDGAGGNAFIARHQAGLK